jgi:hypothetical protein
MKRVSMSGLFIWISSIILFFILPINNIDKDLQGYYKEYMDLAKSQCNKIKPPTQFSIRFGKLSDDNIGVCTYYLNRREILIDISYWRMSNLETRKQLMFHELTHCILDMHHIDLESNYMNSYLIELPKDVLYEQVKDNMVKFCNGE